MGDAEEPIPSAPDDLTYEPVDVEDEPRPLARDPVCGRDVDPAHPGASTEYRAVPYYFCSQLCKQEFLTDPVRYAGG
jgi:YHS domain-containing protein